MYNLVPGLYILRYREKFPLRKRTPPETTTGLGCSTLCTDDEGTNQGLNKFLPQVHVISSCCSLSFTAALSRTINIIPIIAKNLAVGAAFSRDSRLQGAPTRPYQKLTSGEFRKQHEIVIASVKSCGEMDCRVVINATVGFTLLPIRYF